MLCNCLMELCSMAAAPLSRGFIMNTYAFVCAAVPLLMGTPVVKYSQALGTFKLVTFLFYNGTDGKPDNIVVKEIITCADFIDFIIPIFAVFHGKSTVST